MSAEIHQAFADREVIAAGKMTAIGLEPLKARLGSKWDRLSGLVHALFEAAIKRSIQPGDAFFNAGELTFVVIYRNLSVTEAQRKCAEVARYVCGRLFGEEGAEISIRNVVGDVYHKLLDASKNIESAIDEALERDGTETIISANHIKAAIAAAATNPRFELYFTQQRGMQFTCSLDQLSFGFRPIWDCAFDMLIAYLCQPVRPGDRVLSANAGFCTTTGSDEEIAVLDAAILSHCLKHVEKPNQGVSRVMLAAPLHFSTLARPRAWAEFSKTYRTIPRDVLSNMTFVVFSLEGVPNQRLVQELSKLSGRRHVFCALGQNSPVGERFAGTAIHGVGMEIPSKDVGTADRIKSMAHDVRSQSLEPFVLGLQNTSSAIGAMAAGVRYLEGPAIHPMVDAPRSAVAHGLANLYSLQSSQDELATRPPAPVSYL
jgi:hypothetical protein